MTARTDFRNFDRGRRIARQIFTCRIDPTPNAPRAVRPEQQNRPLGRKIIRRIVENNGFLVFSRLLMTFKCSQVYSDAVPRSRSEMENKGRLLNRKGTSS